MLPLVPVPARVVTVATPAETLIRRMLSLPVSAT